jgi:uncharacterized membrane protein
MIFKIKWILPCLVLFVCLLNIGVAKATIANSEDFINSIASPDSLETPVLLGSAKITDTSFRAKVIKILESSTVMIDGRAQEYQRLELKILNGDEKGKEITIDHGKDFVIGVFQKVRVGETVILAKPANTQGQNEVYYITDRYRAPNLIFITAIFFILAIYFGRKRGLTSVVGLIFSVIVIFNFIIPRILKGGDPLWACVIGAIIIILLSLYLSHGFNKRTSIALVSSLLCLVLAVVVDLLFVYIAKLAGNGTEEAFYLQFSTFNLNLQGLLLGSIIIGVIGVLDDVTTGQAAAIEEISMANNSLNFQQLYKSGLSIGREHIASLVNTLFLAYVGASFPLLLLYSTQKTQSLWVTLNSNFIAEEVVRTLVGSTVLVIAVPLTTFLAAIYYSRQQRNLPGS